MNCHRPLHNNPQERSSHLLSGGDLNSRSFSASQYIPRFQEPAVQLPYTQQPQCTPTGRSPVRFILVLHNHLHLGIKIIPFRLAFPTNTPVHFSPVQRMTQAYVVFLIGSSEKCLMSDTNHKQFSCYFLHHLLSVSSTDIPSFSMHVLK